MKASQSRVDTNNTWCLSLEICSVAKLVYGLMQSLDGYVDHMKLGPPVPAVSRHFLEEVRGGLAHPFRLRCQIERLPRPCPCVLCRDRAGNLTWLHPHLMEIKIPALSQKTRQGPGHPEG